MKQRGTAHGEAVMTFEEIARELGVTRGCVCMAYRRAMCKLAHGKRARQVQKILELARSKEVRSV